MVSATVVPGAEAEEMLSAMRIHALERGACYGSGPCWYVCGGRLNEAFCPQVQELARRGFAIAQRRRIIPYDKLLAYRNQCDKVRTRRMVTLAYSLHRNIVSTALHPGGHALYVKLNRLQAAIEDTHLPPPLDSLVQLVGNRITTQCGFKDINLVRIHSAGQLLKAKLPRQGVGLIGI